jgi:hypothetical protein
MATSSRRIHALQHFFSSGRQYKRPYFFVQFIAAWHIYLDFYRYLCQTKPKKNNDVPDTTSKIDIATASYACS